MTEGEIVLVSLPQADGQLKVRPSLVLRRLPPFNDFSFAAFLLNSIKKRKALTTLLLLKVRILRTVVYDLHPLFVLAF